MVRGMGVRGFLFYDFLNFRFWLKLSRDLCVPGAERQEDLARNGPQFYDLFYVLAEIGLRGRPWGREGSQYYNFFILWGPRRERKGNHSFTIFDFRFWRNMARGTESPSVLSFFNFKFGLQMGLGAATGEGGFPVLLFF